jgi:glycosyltransferase involved in cell wall biosynthesis
MRSKHNTKINILFIVPGLGRGGAETQLVDLSNGLDDGLFNKSLVFFNPYKDQVDRLNIDSDGIVYLPRKSKFDFSVIEKVARIIDERNIDIVHCTMQFALLMGWLARRSATRQPKLVAAIHTTKNVSVKNELLDRLVYRWILGVCDKVVFVCRTQTDYWLKRFPELGEKAVVVYNGVDAKKYSAETLNGRDVELRKELGVAENAAVMSCIAGFRKEKGHAILFQAFERAAVDDAVLVLAGDGRLRSELMSQVEELGLQDRVIFGGKMADVRPLLGMSQLSVLASTAVETFSIAMLESMAMRVPVLATNIGGLHEAITPGQTGDLLEPGQVEEMSEKIRSLMTDKAKCAEMGNTAQDLVMRKFTNEAMAERMQRLFVDVHPVPGSR